MTSGLALEAESWLRQHNVEAVLCWLPDFNQVCEGVHLVMALGNDGMAVNIVIDNEAARAAAFGDDRAVDLLQLAYLSRVLRDFRRQEVLAGQEQARRRRTSRRPDRGDDG